MKTLTKKQEFIMESRKMFDKKVNPLIKKRMAEYKKRFGFTYTDMWLWSAGCNSDLELILEAQRQMFNRRKP